MLSICLSVVDVVTVVLLQVSVVRGGVCVFYFGVAVVEGATRARVGGGEGG